MKSLDNTLRTINEYLKDMYDIFGGSSKEYSRALQQVRANIPAAALESTARTGLHYSGNTPTEPLQLARGKAAQTVLQPFAADLSNLRAEQRTTGTAKVQQQAYIKQLKIQQGTTPAAELPAEKQLTAANIKRMARELYEFDNNVNDWYDAVMSDENLSDADKETIKDLYRDIRSDYDDAHFREGLKQAVDAARLKGAKAAHESTHTAAIPEGMKVDISKIIKV